MLSLIDWQVVLFGNPGPVHRAYDSRLDIRGWSAEPIWVTACGNAVVLHSPDDLGAMSYEAFDAIRQYRPLNPATPLCGQCFPT